MSSPLAPRARPRPPGLYRAARALRRLGTIALVLTVVFVAVVGISAVQIVKSRPQVGTSSVALEPNGTVGYDTSFSLSNPTYFAIQSFGLQFRILNASGGLLLADGTPVTSIPAGSSATVPVTLFLPLSAGTSSLLTVDQYLDWNVWGNATYGYLFPVSLQVATERAWGAPFANLTVSVGAPVMMGGTVEVPVTISFSDDASFADVGTLAFQVVSSGGAVCSSSSLVLDVPAGSPYTDTDDVPVASGCNPAGGEVQSQYIVNGASIPLPPEAIP